MVCTRGVCCIRVCIGWCVMYMWVCACCMSGVCWVKYGMCVCVRVYMGCMLGIYEIYTESMRYVYVTYMRCVVGVCDVYARCIRCVYMKCV